jgi:hypothetical protein
MGTSEQYLLTKARLPLLESKNLLKQLEHRLPSVVRNAMVVCAKLGSRFFGLILCA